MAKVIILPALTVTATLHVYLLIVAISSCNAATLTTNIDGEACQGEIWILTCTGRSHTHRWTLEAEGNQSIDTIMMTYTAGRSVLGTIHQGPYNFTLVSASNDRFESIASTVLMTALNNTVAKCVDIQSEAQPVTIRIAAPPSPPQVVRSRVFESEDTLSVEVAWEPPDNDSSVDFYHFEVVAESEGINHTLYAVETPNTTIILSIFPYNVNVTVFLSATDSCGTRSVPIVLSLSYIGTDTSTVHVTPSDDQISTYYVLPINTLSLESESPTSITIGTSQPSSAKFLIPIYVLSSAVFIGLCVIVLVGFAVVCKITITKRQITSMSVRRDSNEVVDTIYETINTSNEDLGIQITMTNNDAYIQFHSSTGINITSNEAYNVVPVKQNRLTYQAGHHLYFPNVADHSDDTKKQGNLGDHAIDLENPCTNTTTDSECLRVTVQSKGDSYVGNVFDS